MQKPLPTLTFELDRWQAGADRVAGIDEVGRGCIAGGVMAAAVILPATSTLLQDLGAVRDSKQLSRIQRQELFPQIMTIASAVGLGGATVKEIDRLNIRQATILAMQRALAQVQPVDWVLVDGLFLPELGIPHQGIVKGDQHCLSIAAASIVAKVKRDRVMAQISQRFPGYGWEHNAGYGTAFHYRALERLGITPHHRRSFLRSWLHHPASQSPC
jgi:ribonuclease HII